MDLFHYVKKYKDNDFKKMTFNEVDALILSLLPYLSFKNIVPAFKEGKISLNEAALKINEKENTGLFVHNTYKLIMCLKDTKRFSSILLYHYMNVVNDEMQFGALTFKLPDKSVFVAFAGTDSSIVGWEEDFKMAYLYPGASQKYASVYLNKTIKLFDYKIRIGGHSKGGNLAICAGMNANFFIKKRIKQIYNFDGPGFLKEQVASREYQKIMPRIKMFVPENSIIGMILYHVDHYTVVRSKNFHLFQHDAFNWKLNNQQFLVSKQSKRSKNLEKKLTKKLEDLSIPERLNLVQNLFQLFRKNRIKDTKEIKLKSLLGLLKSFQELDKETKNLLIEFLMLLLLQ